MALALTPEGSVKKVTRLACGLGVTAALLAVGTDFDLGGYALRLRQYRERAALLAGTGEEETRQETRMGIEEECGAYICHKGEELGLSLRAEVRAIWSEEGYWVPWSAVISGKAEETERGRLRKVITAELGIPPERQMWEETDENEAQEDR